MLDIKPLLLALLCLSCSSENKPVDPPAEQIPFESEEKTPEPPVELLRECSGEAWTLVSFNLQSGDSDLSRLIGDLSRLPKDVDVWAFQEVDPEWFEALVEAIESWTKQDYEGFISRSGNDDRLMFVYKADRFELELIEELDYINIKGRVRSPLHLGLVSRESNEIVSIVNNHLYRGSTQRATRPGSLTQWLGAPANG